MAAYPNCLLLRKSYRCKQFLETRLSSTPSRTSHKSFWNSTPRNKLRA